MEIEESAGLREREKKLIDRRGLVAASAGAVLLGFASTLATAAQSATPEAEAEADPVADPEPDPEPDFSAGTGAFTLYSGRNETLVGPLIEEYAEETGTSVDTRYGGTGELAATILEEGEDTPASLFFSQDAGALGLLAEEGRLATLPEELLDRVEERFRDPEGRWVGVTGRARVLAYNNETVAEDELPASVRDLADTAWAGRLGWAPENASFQAFITAFRLIDGDDAVRSWLETMIANGTVNFGDSNSAIVQAIGNGEIDAGLVNHYYLYAVGREAGENFPVANHFFAGGDPGSLINVAGIGLIEGADDADAALAFADYLLSDEAQGYFAAETFEYPLVEAVAAPEGLVPLSEIGHPDIELGDLADLRGTLELLSEVGLV
ncbi:MAG: extracellular solute-binding protein family 1 [Thermomicrobiales bacterium]|nr:extracellular solute-binding protein family 1 [Thermomicrobiales bacterium]MDF2757749.1 extracellular solute-binding protein family 1 [Thermomicrobiales bacterium]